MQFKVWDLGLVDFIEAWQQQKEVFAQVENSHLAAALILCRHRPVITLGRHAKKENVRIGARGLERKGIKIYQVERGGDATYHGPGQITAYPIVNLVYFKKDLHFFLRQLEEVIIQLLSDWGIRAQRRPGLTGVWIGQLKIASIGIAVKRWITFHGVSMNIKKNDLDNFSLIRPCGMDIQMTALESLLGEELEIDSIKAKMIERFDTAFHHYG